MINDTPTEVVLALRKLAPTLTDGELHDAYLAVIAEHTRRGLDVEVTDPVFPKWMTPSMKSALTTIESVCYARGISLDRDSISKLGKHRPILDGFLMTTRTLCDQNKVKSPVTDQKYTFADFLRALSTVQVHRTITYCKVQGINTITKRSEAHTPCQLSQLPLPICLPPVCLL